MYSFGNAFLLFLIRLSSLNLKQQIFRIFLQLVSFFNVIVFLYK